MAPWLPAACAARPPTLQVVETLLGGKTGKLSVRRGKAGIVRLLTTSRSQSAVRPAAEQAHYGPACAMYPRPAGPRHTRLAPSCLRLCLVAARPPGVAQHIRYCCSACLRHPVATAPCSHSPQVIPSLANLRAGKYAIVHGINRVLVGLPVAGMHKRSYMMLEPAWARAAQACPAPAGEPRCLRTPSTTQLCLVRAAGTARMSPGPSLHTRCPATSSCEWLQDVRWRGPAVDAKYGATRSAPAFVLPS